MKPADFLLLVKDPAKGKVKRRLGDGVGELHAARLYRTFVEDLLGTFGEASVIPTICYYPAEAGDDILGWLGPRYRYLAQRGEDHPNRLRFAFEDMFAQGSDGVVILASDNPDLPAELLSLASEALGHGDAVLGPTQDGGYYLVGFRRDALVPEAFRDIDWSTERVFRQTADRIEKRGKSLKVLPLWYDVDTAADLRAMFRRSRSSGFRRSRTMEYLQRYPELTAPRSGGEEDA